MGGLSGLLHSAEVANAARLSMMLTLATTVLAISITPRGPDSLGTRRGFMLAARTLGGVGTALQALSSFGVPVPGWFVAGCASCGACAATVVTSWLERFMSYGLHSAESRSTRSMSSWRV